MRHQHGTTSRTARALRTSAAGAVSATLVAGTALGLAPAAEAASGATAGPTTRFVGVEGDGGTVLKANGVAPADASRAHPLLVLPTSWGLPQVEYLPRHGNSPKPVTSWSVTTSAASGNPADT